MRGPGIRLDLDVRRVWRCPQCGKQRRLGGDVATATCTCGTRMQLAEERRARFQELQPLVSRELTVASFGLTEEELSRPSATPRTPGESSAPSDAPRPSAQGTRGRSADAPASRSPRPDVPQSEVPVPPGERAIEDSPPSSEEGFGAGLDEPPGASAD